LRKVLLLLLQLSLAKNGWLGSGTEATVALVTATCGRAEPFKRFVEAGTTFDGVLFLNFELLLMWLKLWLLLL
jgi:hypothetical protein